MRLPTLDMIQTRIRARLAGGFAPLVKDRCSADVGPKLTRSAIAVLVFGKGLMRGEAIIMGSTTYRHLYTALAAGVDGFVVGKGKLSFKGK